MEDLIITVAATIQAAEIQAEATIKSACIGATGICVGVIISWCTALHLQKVARLTEVKSVVYLEMIESYSNMTMGMTAVLFDSFEKWANHQNLIANFNSSLEKVRFICETETKVKITNSFSIFWEVYNNIDELVPPIRKIREDIINRKARKNEITTLFGEKFHHFEELKKADPNNSELNNILKSMNRLIEELEEVERELKNDEDILREKSVITQIKINETIKNLNLKFLPIIHLLRKEIGAKTDVQKDLFLYKPLK